MTRAIMFDLETMGKRPGCIILSIGACVFDPHTDWIGDTLHIHIDGDESELRGFKANMGTVRWWLKQDAEPRAALEAGQQTMFWMTLPAQLNAWYWQAWTEAYRP